MNEEDFTNLISKFEWSKYSVDGNINTVINALKILSSSSNIDEIDNAYWNIDSTVVVNDVIYGSALPVVRCLIVIIRTCSSEARAYVLELLVRIVTSEVHPDELKFGNTKLTEKCTRELHSINELLFSIIENSFDTDEILWVIDLLGASSEYFESINSRFLNALYNVKTKFNDETSLEFIDNWIRDLSMV